MRSQQEKYHDLVYIYSFSHISRATHKIVYLPVCVFSYMSVTLLALHISKISAAIQIVPTSKL